MLLKCSHSTITEINPSTFLSSEGPPHQRPTVWHSAFCDGLRRSLLSCRLQHDRSPPDIHMALGESEKNRSVPNISVHLPATNEFNEDLSVQKFIKEQRFSSPCTLTLQPGGGGGCCASRALTHSNPGDRMRCPQMSEGRQRRAGAHVNAYEGLATIWRAL